MAKDLKAKKSLQKLPVLQTVSATALAQETSTLKVLQTFSLWASSTTLIHLICVHTVQSALGFPLPGLLLCPVNMLIPKQRLLCQKDGRKGEGKSAESLVPTCSVNLTSQCISKVKSSNSSKPGEGTKSPSSNTSYKCWPHQALVLAATLPTSLLCPSLPILFFSH